jgi:hypothetical protein
MFWCNWPIWTNIEILVKTSSWIVMKGRNGSLNHNWVPGRTKWLCTDYGSMDCMFPEELRCVLDWTGLSLDNNVQCWRCLDFLLWRWIRAIGRRYCFHVHSQTKHSVCLLNHDKASHIFTRGTSDSTIAGRRLITISGSYVSSCHYVVVMSRHVIM